MKNRIVIGALVVFACALLEVADAFGGTDPGKPKSLGQALRFTAKPVKPTFRIDEDVVLQFRLKNLSEARVFVSRYMPEEFVGVTLIGPDGKEVLRHGRVRSVAYGKDAFLFLEPGQEISASRTISAVAGEGFTIAKSGRYTVRAEYSLGPPEYFAKLAPKGAIPEGRFKAPEAHFIVVGSKDAKP